MGRAPCCEKVGLKRGRWTAEEDDILIKYIQVNGEGSWRSLPKNAGLLRCGKSCRLRWINYLRADLKRGHISAEEEDIIIKLHGSYGNRWSLIASHLPGRTDNEIKNYWNSHLSRRIHTFIKADNESVTVVMDIGMPGGGHKRRGGRTSRSAMKKNTRPSSLEHIRKEKQQQDLAHGAARKFPMEPSVPDNGVTYDTAGSSSSGLRMTELTKSPLSKISYEAFENEMLWFSNEEVLHQEEFVGSSTELESEMLSPTLEVDASDQTPEAEAIVTAGIRLIDGVVGSTGERQIPPEDQWLFPALEDEWINMDWDWEGVAEDKMAREKEGRERWSWLWDSAENIQETPEEKSYAAWLLSSDVNLL